MPVPAKLAVVAPPPIASAPLMNCAAPVSLYLTRACPDSVMPGMPTIAMSPNALKAYFVGVPATDFAWKLAFVM